MQFERVVNEETFACPSCKGHYFGRTESGGDFCLTCVGLVDVEKEETRDEERTDR